MTCLSLAILETLVQYLQVRLETVPVGPHLQILNLTRKSSLAHFASHK